MTPAPTPSQPLWRRLLFIPPLIVGVVVLAILVGGKSPPTKVERVAQAPVVRVIAVPQVDLAPMALGYGVVQPARVWTAVAQVAGRVIETHPRLDDGEFVKEGELLVRIDPVDYELALAEAQAQLAELEVQAINAAASLALEERSLALAEDELARNRSLADKGTASKSAADQAERTSLTASTAVQNMRNTLALIPTQRHLLEARIDQVRLDIERTAIRAPFDLRLAKVKVELAQYVPVGSSLLEGDSLDRVEVVAQVPIGRYAQAVPGSRSGAGPRLGDGDHACGAGGHRRPSRAGAWGYRGASGRGASSASATPWTRTPAPWVSWSRWTGPTTRSSPATARP